MASETAVPAEFSVAQNYPNPFNATTVIGFSLPKPSDVEIEILNVLGQRVVLLYAGVLGAGEHRFEWDGKNSSGTSVSSGIYLYRVVTGEGTEIKKMVMLK